MATSEDDSTLTEIERLRSTLDASIAAYAARHGGGSDNVDLDTALEAASVEFLLDAEMRNGR
jgi:DNA-binding FadR family transcriptional regulator